MSRSSFAPLALILASGCASRVDTGQAPPSTDTVKILRLSGSNVETYGFDAVRPDGIAGDFLIANDRVTAIIDQVGTDPSRDIPMQRHRAPSGGTLIDLGLTGGADQWVQIYQALNYDPELPVVYRTLRVGEGAVTLIAEGGVYDPGRKTGLEIDAGGLADGLVIRTTWSMVDRSPWVEVRTEVLNTSSQALPLSEISDLVVVDGLGLRTFVPAPGWGFDITGKTGTLAPWVVFSGEATPDATYAILSPDEHMVVVRPFTEADGRVRIVGVGRPVTGAGGIEAGGSITWTRSLLVDDQVETSGIADLLLSIYAEASGSDIVALGFRHRGRLHARLAPPVDGDIVFERLSPSTFVGGVGEVMEGGVLPVSGTLLRKDQGEVEAVLPVGGYQVRVRASGGEERLFPVEVVEEGVDAGSLDLEGMSPESLTVHLLDEKGALLEEPYRLTVVGLGGTEDPSFEPLASTEAAVGAGSRVWMATGSVELPLMPGSYRILAGRGPASDVVWEDVRVPGVDLVELHPDRARLGGPAHQALDPVTGTSVSFFGDSQADDLALAALAEGIDVYGRTEAQRAETWTSAREGQVGVTGVLGTLDVPRITAPKGDGWLVALPMGEDISGPGQIPGAWLEEANAGGALFTMLLAPRASSVSGIGTGYFEAHGYSRLSGLESAENAFLWETGPEGLHALDASALELLSPRAAWRTDATLGDWYAFLEAGFRLQAGASSSCFSLGRDALGSARIMVREDSERVEDLLRGAAEGRSFVTSGPFVEVEAISGDRVARPGEILVREGGDLRLDVTVRASNWVPTDSVRVILNGRVVSRWSLDPESVSEEIRFMESVPLEVVRNPSWIVVEVGKPDVEPGGLFSQVNPGVPSFAATSPIWIEASAEGP